MALRDRNKRVRNRAATSLVKLNQSFPELAPILVGALEDEDRNVRSKAAEGLGKVGKDFPTLTPAFVSALVAASMDRDAAVRSIAVEAALHDE